MVKLLVEFGASLDLEGEQGSARDVAFSCNHFDIIDFLHSWSEHSERKANTRGIGSMRLKTGKYPECSISSLEPFFTQHAHEYSSIIKLTHKAHITTASLALFPPFLLFFSSIKHVFTFHFYRCRESTLTSKNR